MKYFIVVLLGGVVVDICSYDTEDSRAFYLERPWYFPAGAQLLTFDQVR